jgi:hypothetical protein
MISASLPGTAGTDFDARLEALPHDAVGLLGDGLDREDLSPAHHVVVDDAALAAEDGIGADHRARVFVERGRLVAQDRGEAFLPLELIVLANHLGVDHEARQLHRPLADAVHHRLPASDQHVFIAALLLPRDQDALAAVGLQLVVGGLGDGVVQRAPIAEQKVRHLLDRHQGSGKKALGIDVRGEHARDLALARVELGLELVEEGYGLATHVTNSGLNHLGSMSKSTSGSMARGSS